MGRLGEPKTYDDLFVLVMTKVSNLVLLLNRYNDQRNHTPLLHRVIL